MYRVLLLAMLLILPVSAAAGEKPLVAVSIRPLHSLATLIGQDAARVELLTTASSSPHGYRLRPSEIRTLTDADLVIWLDPSFESFLRKPLANLPDQKKSMPLADELSGLTLLPLRAGGRWAEADDHHGHDHGHSHDRHGASLDPHVWLTPTNATVILKGIAARLIRIDPDNTAIYTRNLKTALKQVADLDQELQQRLAPLRQKRYIVFHDAYQYFEKHYGLHPLGALALDPERRPGARRLTELKRAISQEGVDCVFSEPQFEPALVRTLTEGTSVRTGVLDPLGSAIEAGGEHYFTLLRQMASSLESCLARKED